MLSQYPFRVGINAHPTWLPGWLSSWRGEARTTVAEQQYQKIPFIKPGNQEEQISIHKTRSFQFNITFRVGINAHPTSLASFPASDRVKSISVPRGHKCPPYLATNNCGYKMVRTKNIPTFNSHYGQYDDGQVPPNTPNAAHLPSLPFRSIA